MRFKRLRHSTLLMLSLIQLSALSACDQFKPPPPHKKGNTRDLLAKYDKPIVFIRRTIGYISRNDELGKYVCQTLENQLMDRYLVHKQYSAKFILKTLSELPTSLQNIYATCYLEGELKEEGFSKYFGINLAFLGPQALEGYKAMGALPQIKLLAKALTLGAHQSKKPKEIQRYENELSALDKLWAQQNPKELNALRGAYSKQQFDTNAWPMRDKKEEQP